MATKKKNTFIDQELEWLEARAADIIADIDANPYSLIKDRTKMLATPSGSKEVVVAKEEDQKKAIREALKDYTQLLDAINKLREREELKKEARGGEDVPYAMKDK